MSLKLYGERLTPLHQQAGVTLIIALVIVLLMAIVGMAAMRGSGLQEAMVGNMRDRNLALQAAEAGLREGEIKAGDPKIVTFDGSVKGYYSDLLILTPAPTHPSPSKWSTANWEAWSNQVATENIKIPNVFEQPRYVVEKLAYTIDADSTGGCKETTCVGTETKEYYRVTSRAVGATADAAVMLQTTYVRLIK